MEHALSGAQRPHPRRRTKAHDIPMVLAGKGKTRRLLDGIEHSAMPRTIMLA
jgi:hypothetical protein